MPVAKPPLTTVIIIPIREKMLNTSEVISEVSAIIGATNKLNKTIFITRPTTGSVYEKPGGHKNPFYLFGVISILRSGDGDGPKNYVLSCTFALLPRAESSLPPSS